MSQVNTFSLLMHRSLILLVGSLLLTACSSGPSEQDIQQAIEANYQKINQFGSMLGMQKNMIDLKHVEKIGCQQAREHVYRCDLVIEGNNMLLGDQKETSSLLFMQTKEGWVLVDH